MANTGAAAMLPALEDAYKKKLEAQAALIDGLKAEVSRLQTQASSEGPVPVALIKRHELYKAAAEEAAAAQATIATLQAELAEARAAAAAAKAAPPPAHLLRELALLRLLSNLQVQVLEAAGSDPADVCGMYHMSSSEADTGKRVEFTLDIFRAAVVDEADGAGEGEGATQGEGELHVDYVPGNNATELLPPFLHGPVTFSLDQAPMFLAKVTEQLRHMTEGEGEGEGEGEAQGSASGGDAAASAAAPFTPGDQAASADDAPMSAIGVDGAGQVLVTLDGQELELDLHSMTPAAVRKARTLNLGTPSAAAASGMRTAATPAATPANQLRGIRAPAATPAAPATASGAATTAAVDGDGDAVVADLSAALEDAGSSAAAASAAPAAAAAAAVAAAGRGTRSAAASASAAAAAPRTVMAVRKSSRMAASTTRMSMSAKPARRSIGHVVDAGGLLFSPTNK